MNIQLRKLHLLIQQFIILQLRHTTFITQSLKEIHSGRETGLIDTGPLVEISFNSFVQFLTEQIALRTDGGDNNIPFAFYAPKGTFLNKIE